MIEELWSELRTRGMLGGLRAVDLMAREVSSLKWFGRVAVEPSESTIRSATALGACYTESSCTIAAVSSWNQARRLVDHEAEHFIGRASEDREIEALKKSAGERFEPSLVAAIVDEATQLATDSAMGLAADAAMRSGVADGNVIKLAGVSAGRAFRAAALARIVEAYSHAALHRLDLYAIGHWPLGLSVEKRQVHLF